MNVDVKQLPAGDGLKIIVRAGTTIIGALTIEPTSTSANAAEELKALEAYAFDLWLARGPSSIAEIADGITTSVSSAIHIRRVAYGDPHAGRAR